MKLVNIAELKDHLSRYLKLVRGGEPVLVKDRDRIIARIEPASDASSARTDAARRLAELELNGVIRRGHGRITPELLARRPQTSADAVGALLAEREEGP